MEKAQEKPQEVDVLDIMPKAKIKVFFMSLLYTLIFIAIFALIGFIIDLKFGSSPKGLLISVVASYPLNRLFLTRKIRQLAQKKLTQVTPQHGQYS